MLRLAADENFNGRIVRGLLRLLPALDLVRVQDTPLAAATDAEVLEWAAREGRVVLTHDLRSFSIAAQARVRRGLPMAGVITVRRSALIGQALEEIQLLVEAARSDELDGRVLFVPLRGETGREV